MSAVITITKSYRAYISHIIIDFTLGSRRKAGIFRKPAQASTDLAGRVSNDIAVNTIRYIIPKESYGLTKHYRYK